MIARRLVLGGAAALAAPRLLRAQGAGGAPLRVGDQRGNARAVLEASGVLAAGSFGDRIAWSEFPAAAPLVEALNAGAIDAGLVGDAPFTFGAAAGAPIRAIAATRENREGLAILVAKDSPYQSIRDLRGKRIATGRGSIGHQVVLAALEKEGLPLDAVTLVFLLPADAKAAWTRGSVEAWATWEPYVSQEEVLNGARRVANGEGITPGLSFVAARTDAIAARRDDLSEFVRRLAAARAWANTNVEGYARTWSGLMNVPAPVAEHWFRRAGTRVAPIDDFVVGGQQQNIDLYTRAGLVRRRIEARDLLDPSFNGAVEAGNRGA